MKYNKLIVILCIFVIILFLYLHNTLKKEGLEVPPNKIVLTPTEMYTNMKNLDLEFSKNVIHYLLDTTLTFAFTMQGLEENIAKLVNVLFYGLTQEAVVSCIMYFIINEIVKDNSMILYNHLTEVSYVKSIGYILIHLEMFLNILPPNTTEINTNALNQSINEICAIIKTIADVKTNINNIDYEKTKLAIQAINKSCKVYKSSVK